MNISERGLNLIKSYEGCRLTAYRCPANVLTIGWGHTKNVYEGMSITQDEADRLLVEDVQVYANAVNKYVSKFNFNQNQFDALVSFAYNCGIGSLDSVCSCNTLDEIRAELPLYVNGGGVRLPGLVRRRNEELALFNEGCTTSFTPNINNTEGEVLERSYPEKGIATVIVDKLNVRNVPSTENNEPVDYYTIGKEINYDSVYVTNKYYYISYVSESGIRRYVASRSRAGEQYLNCI